MPVYSVGKRKPAWCSATHTIRADQEFCLLREELEVPQRCFVSCRERWWVSRWKAPLVTAPPSQHPLCRSPPAQECLQIERGKGSAWPHPAVAVPTSDYPLQSAL